MDESHNKLSAKTLIVVCVLLIYNVSSRVFEKLEFHYLHESGFCMIIGMLISLLASVINPNEDFTKNLTFDGEMFFNLILPPIIFAAGYNLRKRSFFKFFKYSFIYGVVGSFISFGIISPLIYICNENEIFRSFNEGKLIKFQISDILCFAAIISATDTVAPLTFIKEKEQPKLFALLFGEGVFNDAICIVLYKIIVKMWYSSEPSQAGNLSN